MEIRVEVADANVWDAALLQLPAPHVLQSWAWGAFKARHGWEATPLLWRDAEQTPRAAALLLQRRSGGRALLYTPKGPLLDWTDMALAERVLADLATYARDHAALLLKIDPDVRSDTSAGAAVMALLQRRGWRRAFEQVQFKNTMCLDLTPDLDTLMAGMKSKWRYNVRLAVRRGVNVREAEVAELPVLYEMYAETALRDGFIIREAAYYLDAWRTFVEAGLALPLVAEYEGALLSMLILFHFGARAWYMYGASRELHRQVMPNHLLQWETIRRAQALGCRVYDLWGAPDVLDESDPLWGVYRFKEGFGAAFTPHIGAYDYTPQGWLYRLYRWARSPLLSLAQWRYWRAKSEG